jgi:hypothetical protein
VLLIRRATSPGKTKDPGGKALLKFVVFVRYFRHEFRPPKNKLPKNGRLFLGYWVTMRLFR